MVDISALRGIQQPLCWQNPEPYTNAGIHLILQLYIVCPALNPDCVNPVHSGPAPGQAVLRQGGSCAGGGMAPGQAGAVGADRAQHLAGCRAGVAATAGLAQGQGLPAESAARCAWKGEAMINNGFQRQTRVGGPGRR